jgi:glucose/arabinose dehydrogenase/plastocyanin
MTFGKSASPRRSLFGMWLVLLAFLAGVGVLVAGSVSASASANTQHTGSVAIPTIPTGTEALPPGANLETVTPNMGNAIAMVFDPVDPSRLFYTVKQGTVRLIINGVLQPNPVISFSVSSSSERGLLGIAMDPQFGVANRYIYVYYTSNDQGQCGGGFVENKVVRFEENGGVGSNPQEIFDSCQSAGNHVGGNIHFGPDGKLYISIGDNAVAGNSQNLGVEQGKTHRINSDGTIPPDNPGFPPGALPSLYAIGLRNSFDFTFDTVDTTAPYRIFMSENGPGCDDEMNRIEAGYNYGWRSSYPCDDGNVGGPDPAYNTIPPLWFLPSGACCEAPTGIEVYSGSNIPQWQNHLFMCSYNNSAFRHFYLTGDRLTATNVNRVNGISCNTDIETGPDGNLYYIQGGGYSNGTLMRVTGPGGGNTPTATVPAPTSTRTNTVAAPTNTLVPSATRTNTAIVIPTSTLVPPTLTALPSSTGAPPSATRTSVLPTGTSVIPSATAVSTGTAQSTGTAVATSTSAPPTSTATVCTMPFTDVPPTDPFYPFIRCLYCRGIIGGYNDGTFRPNNPITRGQIAKIVAQSAGFTEPAGPQIYEDVPPASPFYQWINNLSTRGHMGGYPCGQRQAETCVPPENRPYFRPNESATRGQLSKIVSNAAGYTEPHSGQFYTDVTGDNPFYLEIMRLTTRGAMSGYPCGGPGEPCDTENRPYFRWGNTVTRGQASKIVVNTFFGSCPSPSPGTVNVDIIQYDYFPREVTVSVGTTVRWYNYDIDYHTSTSGVCNGNDCTPDGRFDTGRIDQYESSAFTFTMPGTYRYYCIPHPYMQADVIVVP